MSKARYTPPSQPDLSHRFGTRPRDPLTNAILPGPEVNERGDPMGTPAPQGPSALDNFQAGRGAPMLSSFQARQPGAVKPAAPAVGQRTGLALPRPVGTPETAPVTRGVALNGAGPDQHTGMAPDGDGPAARQAFLDRRAANPPAATPIMVSRRASTPSNTTPASPVPQWYAPTSAGPLPSPPDDRALLMATRARDAAARQPEPISIPGGDPTARAWNTARGTGHPSTPEPGMAPRLSDSTVDPRILAVAGTGRALKGQYGTMSSTFGSPTLARHEPEAATASPMSMPGYYPAEPAAATAAPPQSDGRPVAPRLSALRTPEASYAPPPQATAPTPFRTPLAATAAPPQSTSPGSGLPPPVVPPARWSDTSIPTASGTVPTTANSRIIARQSQPGFRGIPQALDPVTPDFSSFRNEDAGFLKTTPPSWSGVRPKRKATPLMDKVAGGYGS